MKKDRNDMCYIKSIHPLYRMLEQRGAAKQVYLRALSQYLICLKFLYLR